MALTIVFLVGLGLAWTDGFQSNSTDILTSLQERQILERLSPSISVITEVLEREIEVRAKHQAEVERRITDHQAEVERRITEHQAEDERRNKEQRTEFDTRIKEKRSELDSEIAKLRSQLMKEIVGPAIAFSARAQSSQKVLRLYQKINFQDMLTNIGGGYNTYTSVFICPVMGVYQFVVTILTTPKARIDTELMAAGVSRMKIYSGGAKYYGPGTNSVLLELQAGDEVYVRMPLYFNGGYVYGNYRSTFNGHLVHKL